MRKIRHKNSGDILKITNRLDKFERINYEALRIIYNCGIDGLIPIEVQTKRTKVLLCAEVSEAISLSDYFSVRLSSQEIFRCLSGIIRIALQCERIGLSSQTFQWDWDSVFIDSRTGRIMMIYWPIFDLEIETGDFTAFFKAFPGTAAWRELEADIAGPFREYLSQKNNIRLQEMDRLLGSVSEKKQRLRDSAELRRRNNQCEETPYVRPYETETRKGGAQSADAWLESLENGDQLLIPANGIVISRSAQAVSTQSGKASVSRRHARIERSNHSTYYVIEDLNSKNGTSVNGVCLLPGQRIRLEDGMRIQLGQCSFIFRQLMSGGTMYVFRQ